MRINGKPICTKNLVTITVHHFKSGKESTVTFAPFMTGYRDWKDGHVTSEQWVDGENDMAEILHRQLSKAQSRRHHIVLITIIDRDYNYTKWSTSDTITIDQEAQHE